MSGPPPPAWHPNNNYPTNYSYGRSYQSGNHPPPPPPPPTVSTGWNVPPPLYGYNANAHYASSQQQQQHEQLYAPVDESKYRCDACQISLESEAALRAHTEAHIKCQQCSFTGSQKVVNGHFAKVHGKFAGGGFKTVTIAVPGCRVQRFRICVGNNPEDVQKWIQDRKRRFPRRQPKTEDASYKEDESKPAPALGSLLDGYGSSSSDSDKDEKTQAADTTQDSQGQEEKNINTTSTSTVDTNMNDSMSTTMERKTPLAETNAVDARSANYKNKTRPCHYFMRNGSCRNGDACNFSHERTTRPPGANSSKLNGKKLKSSSSNTLLRKLLESDARREATLSLQLLQYIVDSNYLQNDQRNAK
jgi:hypothetical protein